MKFFVVSDISCCSSAVEHPEASGRSGAVVAHLMGGFKSCCSSAVEHPEASGRSAWQNWQKRIKAVVAQR